MSNLINIAIYEPIYQEKPSFRRKSSVLREWSFNAILKSFCVWKFCQSLGLNSNIAADPGNIILSKTIRDSINALICGFPKSGVLKRGSYVFLAPIWAAPQLKSDDTSQQILWKVKRKEQIFVGRTNEPEAKHFGDGKVFDWERYFKRKWL